MRKTKREFECKNDPDNFCYVCGDYCANKKICRFTDSTQENYLQYFGIVPEYLNEQWTPSFICNLCRTILYEWASDEKRYMKYHVPMIWRQPFLHETDCYFCLSKQSGTGRNMRWNYANVPSVTFPVLRLDGVPYPECSDSTRKNKFSDLSEGATRIESESEFETDGERKYILQSQFNDMVRELELTKEKSQLLASRLKQYGCLAAGAKKNNVK